MTSENKKSKQLLLTYEDYLNNNKDIIGFQIDRFSIVQNLGRGSFGSVWKAIDKTNNEPVAIKVLDLDAVEKQPSLYKKKVLKRLIQSEAKLMMKFDHPNLIKCFDIFQNASLKLIVMEFCNGGHLQAEVNRNQGLPQEDAVIVLKQILNALATLHSSRIIHRDLKPENILIHEDTYKIADFGFSKQLDSENHEIELPHTKLGTLHTMAPEVIKGEKYGLQADIWSIGVIFYFMLYAREPYSENSYKGILKEISSSKKIFQMPHRNRLFVLSPQAESFITQCLQMDSRKRLNWKNITDHSLFKKYRMSSIRGTSRPDVNLQISQMHEIKEFEMDPINEVLQGLAPRNIKRQSQSAIETRRQFGNLQGTSTDRLNCESTHLKIEKKSNLSPAEWQKIADFQCLKTQITIQKIIKPLQDSFSCSIDKITVIEIIYLLLARCSRNMFLKQQQIQKNYQKQKSSIVSDLKTKIKSLLNEVSEKQEKYSKKIVDKKDELFQKIKDFLFSFVDCQEGKKRDIFLTDNEIEGQTTHDSRAYTKREQVEFTQRMILKALNELRQDPKVDRKLLGFLKSYEQFCNLKLEEHEDMYPHLERYVETHLLSQQNQ